MYTFPHFFFDIYSRYSASKSKEARQLLDCARAGKVRLWIETIGQNIASLTGSTRLLSEGSSGDVFGGIVESIRSDIVEADHRVRAHLLG